LITVPHSAEMNFGAIFLSRVNIGHDALQRRYNSDRGP
jgi:hypothetical protein